MSGAGGTNTARDARGAADRPSIACCCGTACKHVGVRGKGPPGCTKEPRATALPFGKGIYRIAIVRARPITSITRSCAGCPTGTAQIPAPGRDGGSDPRGCAQTARCVREPQGEPTGKHRIKRKRKKKQKSSVAVWRFPSLLLGNRSRESPPTAAAAAPVGGALPNRAATTGGGSPPDPRSAPGAG